MEIRELKTGDILETISLYRYAFFEIHDKDPSPAERARYMSNYGLGVYEDGKLASALLVHPLVQSVRGRIVPMGGVGAVASFPEYRGRGHIRRLMLKALSSMRDRGQAVSMLNPFKQSFYARFGYVSSQPELTLTTGLNRLAHWLTRDVFPGDYETVRVPAISVRGRFCSLAERLLPLSHGRAFKTEVGENEWKGAMANREAVILTRDGQDVAGFHFSKRQGSDSESRMSVTHLYSADDAALEACLAFLGFHRDQIDVIDLHVGADAPIWRWFEDGDHRFDIRGGNPWMVRVVDVERAFAGMPVGYPDGRLMVKVDDEQCEWNNRTFSFEASSGTLSVQAVEKGKPDITLSIEQLSALLYGQRPVFRHRRPAATERPTGAASMLTGWFGAKVVRNDWFF